MTVGRRQVMLGSLGLGVAVATGSRIAPARDTEGNLSAPTASCPGGGIDQTATLKEAANAAAKSGTPLVLPAGVYATSRLTLKSGTHVQGVAGKSILRYRDGGAILNVDAADDVRNDGLVLDGTGKALGDGGALLVVTASKHIDVSACRYIAKGGLFSEDAAGLEITHNHVHDCGDNGRLGAPSSVRTARSSPATASSASPPRAAAAARTETA